VTFERFDVVVVPFPFVDRAAAKRRPALVLSCAEFQSQTGNAVLAMITSSRRVEWPGDTPIADLGAAGLSKSCRVRCKLFTLDARLILHPAGRLSDTDQAAVTRGFAEVLP